MSTDSPTDEDRDLHVFDETRDPETIVSDITHDPIYDCLECGTNWNGVAGEVCPDCNSDNRKLIAEEALIRAKWTMDGSESIDQAIEKFEYRAEQLRALKDAGWDIHNPVTNDYAYLRRTPADRDT